MHQMQGGLIQEICLGIGGEQILLDFHLALKMRVVSFIGLLTSPPSRFSWHCLGAKLHWIFRPVLSFPRSCKKLGSHRWRTAMESWTRTWSHCLHCPSEKIAQSVSSVNMQIIHFRSRIFSAFSSDQDTGNTAVSGQLVPFHTFVSSVQVWSCPIIKTKFSQSYYVWNAQIQHFWDATWCLITNKQPETVMHEAQECPCWNIPLWKCVASAQNDTSNKGGLTPPNKTYFVLTFVFLALLSFELPAEFGRTSTRQHLVHLGGQAAGPVHRRHCHGHGGNLCGPCDAGSQCGAPLGQLRELPSFVKVSSNDSPQHCSIPIPSCMKSTSVDNSYGTQYLEQIQRCCISTLQPGQKSSYTVWNLFRLLLQNAPDWSKTKVPCETFWDGRNQLVLRQTLSVLCSRWVTLLDFWQVMDKR